MSLNPISPRLRVRNGSKSNEHVSLVIEAGDELEVSADIAAQLASASGAFKVDDPAEVAESWVDAKKAFDMDLIDASGEKAAAALAEGGPVPTGQTFEVGERGPEIIVPAKKAPAKKAPRKP